MAKAKAELAAFVSKLESDHSLTSAEVINLLGDEITSITHYLIRQERREAEEAKKTAKTGSFTG